MSENLKNCDKLLKLMKKISYLLNDMMNFNEIFRKNVTYDNIKRHKKSRFHPLFIKNIGGHINPPPEPF